MLSVRDLSRSYSTEEGRIDVLRGISLDVERGGTLALTGESGSGKSTLLHLLGCLDVPDGGTIHLDGTAIHDLGEAERAAIRRSKIGLVFQQLNLIPSLDVGANLAFQARLAGRHDPDRVHRLADRLGLADLVGRYPEQLSGGQQQRVAIGRTLAAQPILILADEPTGNLDEATGDRVAELMLDLVAETDAALVVATHSERLAGQLGRRLHLRHGVISE